jgi:hypothetical protein
LAANLEISSSPACLSMLLPRPHHGLLGGLLANRGQRCAVSHWPTALALGLDRFAVSLLTFCVMDRLQLAACARSLQHFSSASSTVLATRAVRKVSWPIGVQLQPLATCSHAWARSVNCRHCSNVVKSSSLIDALDYGYCICFFKRCLQLAARARSLQHFAMQCSSILCRFYRYNLSFVSSSTTLAFLSRSR